MAFAATPISVVFVVLLVQAAANMFFSLFGINYLLLQGSCSINHVEQPCHLSVALTTVVLYDI